MALCPVSQNEPYPSKASVARQKSSVSFLDLPCEVRLQIYHWVHLTSPVRQPQLAPWYPNPNPTSNDDDDEDDDGLARTTTTKTRRPFCRIPTALLQTCRQVHAEARVIPFRANEFVFADLFSTGLSSALAFTRGRRPWQRAEMRFARLEVSARDVVPAAAPAADWTRLADWVQLCGFWSSGLRGLGLVVRTEGRGGRGGRERERRLLVVDGDDVEEESTSLWEMVEVKKGTSTSMSMSTDWIRLGLGRLCGLRELSVQLADVEWTREDKVKWCERLREMLVSCTGRTEMNVVCVDIV